MIRLIEIFDTVTGNTLFYLRFINCQPAIELYMMLKHYDIENWDYEIVL